LEIKEPSLSRRLLGLLGFNSCHLHHPILDKTGKNILRFAVIKMYNIRPLLSRRLLLSLKHV
jgi:hypothetical protein